jgi:hypothetical protein
VEKAFAAALDLKAYHAVNLSQRLQSKASITMMGISSAIIAGNVKTIIGTPASANSGGEFDGSILNNF